MFLSTFGAFGPVYIIISETKGKQEAFLLRLGGCGCETSHTVPHRLYSEERGTNLYRAV